MTLYWWAVKHQSRHDWLLRMYFPELNFWNGWCLLLNVFGMAWPKDVNNRLQRMAKLANSFLFEPQVMTAEVWKNSVLTYLDFKHMKLFPFFYGLWLIGHRQLEIWLWDVSPRWSTLRLLTSSLAGRISSACSITQPPITTKASSNLLSSQPEGSSVSLILLTA